MLRLKFLNGALKLEPPTGFLMRLPVLGSLPHRAMLIVELSKVLPVNKPAPIGLRLTALMYRCRYAVYAACVVFTLAASVGLAYLVIDAGSNLFGSSKAKGDSGGTQPDGKADGGTDEGEAVRAIGSEAGLSLDKVWLAERGNGYEFYSNGTRVLTEYETAGLRRSFYRFNVEGVSRGSDEGELLSRPVGIIYHLSESDLLPFDDKHNSSLQYYSKSLLEYARSHALYNYVIDRFGRVYRIVRDEDAASHAGNSVWSDGRGVYVNLSASFIGVCFEGQSKRGRAVGADGINEAQIYAARALTAVLRSKYAIEDANCVTHGLVSVNPSNHLVGYHTDWVAAFPFGALGLSDKYESELAPISRLGFNYDAAYIAAAGGKRWAGLDKSDAALREAAAARNMTVEEARGEMAGVFERLNSKQRELEKESGQ
ncbi:MAG TPA: peptidoglycan recognition family protein [Blastocatellia bacterium]|nr:peptidoglycan recognition family protein [Blastocatellia bacterium]